MTDRTASIRVKRYRSAQKAERGIERIEVQVPVSAREDIKAIGSRYRDLHRNIHKARRHLEFVLGTINAPRPHPIDEETFVQCLLSAQPKPQWRPHIEAFYDEVSEEAIHDLVLAGLVEFEDLYRAARTWKVTDGRRVPWIKEMADLSLAGPAARYH